jgi:hypothetical protein
MEVISGRRVSGLNPYAAPFVPVAYRAVEDYSPEWWQLMETTPWFRDYWFRECFLDPELVDNYEPSLPDDVDALFYLSLGERLFMPQFNFSVVYPQFLMYFLSFWFGCRGGEREQGKEGEDWRGDGVVGTGEMEAITRLG